MRTFIIFSSPSCCDKHSPRTFCRLICLHNSLFLGSYKSLLGILCCADSAVVMLLLQPHRYHKDHEGLGCSCAVLCSERHLRPISPLEGEGSALGCVLLSLPMIHWKAHFPVSQMLLGSTTCMWAEHVAHADAHYLSQELPHLHYSANPSADSKYIYLPQTCWCIKAQAGLRSWQNVPRQFIHRWDETVY